MKKYFYLSFILSFILISQIYSQVVKLNGNYAGMTVNVLHSTIASTTIEFSFDGYNQNDILINGKDCVSLEVPDMVWLMNKGLPQLPISRKSIVISDRGGVNYKIISREIIERKTNTIMPSKGHYTRNIEPESVTYTFDKFYNSNKWYPEKSIEIEEPYIIRDLRGVTIQFNPMQYNAKKNILRICTKMTIEVFYDEKQTEVNPFIRQTPLTKVASEFSPIYRDLFINYGTDNIRYDSIPEPGRMLVIYAQQYANLITPFVNWKVQKGMTVLTASYPAQTGSGNNAIKSYIQNLYNQTEKLTYIVLIGESDQIPTLYGVYEGAPSDPCYVKLAGNDAYPDAFISRISVPDSNNLRYVLRKIVKYEREPQPGAPWYHQGVGVASNQGTPMDRERANWLRDTLMHHGFTLIDSIYDPYATKQMINDALNSGRSILNYIGHGSGTSWGTTGYNVSDIHNLSNGWMNPFIIDVACLNGNFTLSECMEEAWLRSGDTTNPKGAIGVYGSSTNEDWVPPCDMQSHAMYLYATGRRTTIGGVCFHGLMYAMDLWGGSTGEGLMLMEQNNIFGDCSLVLSHPVITGVENHNTSVSSFSLSQNYPNPFNPTTKIKYQLPKSGFVSLKVFDMLGKEIAVLVNENQTSGIYEKTFDGTALSSGVYFYKLTAGDFNEVKKMILVK